MGFVFVSHVTADDDIVTTIHNSLMDAGIKVWVDHIDGINPGDNFSREIQNAVNECDCGLFVLSAESAKSDYCEAEWQRILALKKKVYVLLIEDLTLAKFPLRLGTIQYTNLSKDYQAGIADLIDNLVPQKIDWGEAPAITTFYGREYEIEQLSKWIVEDHQRIVFIQALGGMGKTCLVVKLGLKIQSKFRYVIWRSLRNAPLFKALCEEWLRILSDQKNIHIPSESMECLSLLIKYLRENRCLLILDNFESILQTANDSGQFRSGYEDYGLLLQRIGETTHQSCLIVTSREKPKMLRTLEANSRSIRTLLLSGLGIFECEKILHNKNLSGNSSELTSLISQYAGNPLAMNLVASTIHEVFSGSVSLFLHSGIVVFDDIYDLLDQQFMRLSSMEQEVLYWLAIEREWSSIADLLADVVSTITNAELLMTILSLQRKSMVEKSSSSAFTLQPVIMEYVGDRLVELVLQEVLSKKMEKLKTHALIKAQAKEYVRNSQIRLLLHPLLERLLKEFTIAGLTNQLMQIVQLARTDLHHASGYVGGNVLNILCHMDIDLTNFDFSHLTIRQAYLRNVDLNYVNFTNADLSTSVFTETFGSVLAVAVSSDATLVAAGASSGEIRVWQADNGLPIITCEGHEDWIRAIIFTSGRCMVSCSEDQTIRIWDVATGQCLKIIRGHTNRVRSLSLSSDESLLLSASEDQTIRLWDLEGRCLWTFTGHTGPARSVDFGRGGTIFASCADDETVRLWDINTKTCIHVLQGHANQVWTVKFSHDGRLLASGGEDGTIRLWNPALGILLRILKGHSGPIRAVVFNSAGNLLASASQDHTIRIWDTNTGKCLRLLEGHTNGVRALAFDPTDKILISGSEDQSVKFWDVEVLDSAQCIKNIQGHTNRIWSVAFTARDHLIAAGGDDQRIHVWNAGTGESVKRIRFTNQIRTIASSSDNRLLAVGSEGDAVSLLDMQTGRTVRTLSGHTGRARCVAFSPDNQLLVSGSDDRELRLWDVGNGQCVRIYRGHPNWVRTVCFSPDGKLIASGAEDGTARLWDAKSDNCLRVFQYGRVWSVAFNPDNTLLAGGCDDQVVRIWNVQNGDCIQILPHTSRGVWAVAFSADGELLASGGDDLVVRIWSTTTWQAVCELTGHTNRIRSLSFSPQGNLLVSGSDDETVKVWNIASMTLKYNLRANRPYESMNITGVTGLTNAQRAMLKALGGLEY
jgi:WD40 repeat protein